MRRHKPLYWILQAVVAVGIVILVWRNVAPRWEEFRTMHVRLAISPAWIVASAAIVWATYGILIEAWRRILLGWDEHLTFPAATRVWALANLGRYIPGKVWSVAGLALLAQRAGVRGWSAAASAGVMQAIAIGTGVAVVAASVRLPGATTQVSLILAAVVAFGTLVAVAWQPTIQFIGRMTGGGTDVKPPRVQSLIVSTLVAGASWLTYGVAFWCLARGLFGANALSFPTALGVFAAGYIIGLIALFAPGGVGAREVVFIGLLAPSLGSGGALALSVASRVLLTITEAGAAFVGLSIRPSTKENDVAPT